MNSNIKKGSFSIIPSVHRDILKNEPILHVVGNNRMDIENHMGIIEYTEKLIRIDSKKGLIILSGRDFLINEIDKYTISVFGEIQNIEFVRDA